MSGRRGSKGSWSFEPEGSYKDFKEGRVVLCRKGSPGESVEWEDFMLITLKARLEAWEGDKNLTHLKMAVKGLQELVGHLSTETPTKGST